jgi:hypothetical protein
MKTNLCFTVDIPKVKGRGKLPPPPTAHPNKVKSAKKKACRAKISERNLEDL